jgi:acyl carrier protein
MPSSEATAAAVRQRVIDWLDDNHHFGDAATLIRDDEMSFMDKGILDSLGFVNLILHLEDSYGIKVNRRELSRANFDSLGKIVRYVIAHADFRGVA